jgi:hypothetical protein
MTLDAVLIEYLFAAGHGIRLQAYYDDSTDEQCRRSYEARMSRVYSHD